MDPSAPLEAFATFGAVLVAFSALVGLYLAGNGLWIWWIQRDPFHSRKQNPNSPIWTFLAGVLLIIAPSFYFVIVDTVAPGSQWTNSADEIYQVDQAALAQIDSAGSPLLEYLPENTVLIVSGALYLFGFFFYLKGVYLYRYAGQPAQGGQSSGFAKANGHLIGGLMVMNIQSLSCALLSLFVTIQVCN